jgi:hypothetical protein
MNITLTMIWCQIVIQLAHMWTFWGGTEWFFLNFDIDNCLLKKIHYITLKSRITNNNITNL